MRKAGRLKLQTHHMREHITTRGLTTWYVQCNLFPMRILFSIFYKEIVNTEGFESAKSLLVFKATKSDQFSLLSANFINDSSGRFCLNKSFLVKSARILQEGNRDFLCLFFSTYLHLSLYFILIEFWILPFNGAALETADFVVIY